MDIKFETLISKALFKRHFKYTLIPFSIWGIASYIAFQISNHSQNLIGFLLFPVICSMGPLIGIASIIKSGDYKKGMSQYWFNRIMIAVFSIVFVFMVSVFTIIILGLYKEN